jgi:hypothetical protein
MYCADEYGDRQFIQNPIELLKKRLRFKILALLEAVCDPNLVDRTR